MIEIKTPSTTIYLQDDGAWFQYHDSPNMYPVVPPDEQNYTYSYGGKLYREACDAIAKYKKTTTGRLLNEIPSDEPSI